MGAGIYLGDPYTGLARRVKQLYLGDPYTGLARKVKCIYLGDPFTGLARIAWRADVVNPIFVSSQTFTDGVKWNNYSDTVYSYVVQKDYIIVTAGNNIGSGGYFRTACSFKISRATGRVYDIRTSADRVTEATYDYVGYGAAAADPANDNIVYAVANPYWVTSDGSSYYYSEGWAEYNNYVVTRRWQYYHNSSGVANEQKAYGPIKVSPNFIFMPVIAGSNGRRRYDLRIIKRSDLTVLANNTVYYTDYGYGINKGARMTMCQWLTDTRIFYLVDSFNSYGTMVDYYAVIIDVDPNTGAYNKIYASYAWGMTIGYNMWMESVALSATTIVVTFFDTRNNGNYVTKLMIFRIAPDGRTVTRGPELVLPNSYEKNNTQLGRISDTTFVFGGNNTTIRTADNKVTREYVSGRVNADNTITLLNTWNTGEAHEYIHHSGIIFKPTGTQLWEEGKQQSTNYHVVNMREG